MKKTLVVLAVAFLALAGMVLGFVAKRAVEASSFGTPVEFHPFVLDAPAGQNPTLGQPGGGACKNN